MKQYHLFLKPIPNLIDNKFKGIDKVLYRLTEVGGACTEDEIDAKAGTLPENRQMLIPVHKIVDETFVKKASLKCVDFYSEARKWPKNRITALFEYKPLNGWQIKPGRSLEKV